MQSNEGPKRRLLYTIKTENMDLNFKKCLLEVRLYYF